MRRISPIVGIAVLSFASSCSASGAALPQRIAMLPETPRERLAGTWEGGGPSDNRARQHVVLELRGDNTYTKTLDTVVDGHHYGGTHSGTWKSQGMKVYLSGDGNWPPYTQDLSIMHKIK